MNELLDHDDSSASRQDRELTLGTGTILGIFFGLVVLCGACFGVGYTMGHKAQPTPLTIADTASDPTGLGSVPKPSAGSPVDNPGLSTTVSPPPAATRPALKPAPVVRKPPAPSAEAADDTDSASPVVRSSEPAAKTPLVKPVAPSALLPSATATATAPAAGSIMVQVAAVSHQEDAQLLVGALHARGYTVAARPSATDSLIHVQVGPFSNKAAAEAMRQRLLTDGYNAMLKF